MEGTVLKNTALEDIALEDTALEDDEASIYVHNYRMAPNFRSTKFS